MIPASFRQGGRFNKVSDSHPCATPRMLPRMASSAVRNLSEIATPYPPTRLRELLDAAGLEAWDVDPTGLTPRGGDHATAIGVDVGEGYEIAESQASPPLINVQSVERIRRFLRLWHRTTDPEARCTVRELAVAACDPFGRFLGDATDGEVVLACLLEWVRLQPVGDTGVAASQPVMTDIPQAALHMVEPDGPLPGPDVLRHELLHDYLRWAEREDEQVGLRKPVVVQANW